MMSQLAFLQRRDNCESIYLFDIWGGGYAPPPSVVYVSHMKPLASLSITQHFNVVFCFRRIFFNLVLDPALVLRPPFAFNADFIIPVVVM